MKQDNGIFMLEIKWNFKIEKFWFKGSQIIIFSHKICQSYSEYDTKMFSYQEDDPSSDLKNVQLNFCRELNHLSCCTACATHFVEQELSDYINLSDEDKRKRDFGTFCFTSD